MTNKEIEVYKNDLVTTNRASIVNIGNATKCDNVRLIVGGDYVEGISTIKVKLPSDAGVVMIAAGTEVTLPNTIENSEVTLTATTDTCNFVTGGLSTAVTFIGGGKQLIGTMNIQFIEGRTVTVVFIKEQELPADEDRKLVLAKGILEENCDVYGLLAYLEDNLEEMQALFKSNEHGEDPDDAITLETANKYVELAKEIINEDEESASLSETINCYINDTMLLNNDSIRNVIETTPITDYDLAVSRSKDGKTIVCLQYIASDDMAAKVATTSGTVSSYGRTTHGVDSIQLDVHEDDSLDFVEFQVGAESNNYLKHINVNCIRILPLEGYNVTMILTNNENSIANTEDDNKQTDDKFDVKDVMARTKGIVDKVLNEPTSTPFAEDGVSKVAICHDTNFTVLTQLDSGTDCGESVYSNLLGCYVYIVPAKLRGETITIVDDSEHGGSVAIDCIFLPNKISIYDLR